MRKIAGSLLSTNSADDGQNASSNGDPNGGTKVVQVKQVANLSMLIDLNGSRETLVFLHGFPDTKEVWLPVLNQLSGKNLVAPDLPSFGSSDMVDDKEMNVTIIADRILSSLTHLGIESFSLVGHDWGGFIAWEIYSKYPQRVTAMYLTNGTHPRVYSNLLKTSTKQAQIAKYASFFTTDGAVDRLRQDQFKALKLYHPFNKETGPGSVSFFEEIWRDPSRLHAALGIYRANLDNIILGRVPDVKASVPLRIFWGKNDHSLVMENATDLEDYCLAGCFYDYVAGGHWAFLEHLDDFCRFLETSHVER
jgi:pimeloyl-ACP methyl ester carboxylesterase